MTILLTAAGLAFMAGISMPAGTFVATRSFLAKSCLKYEVDSLVSYFGGGALLVAIALVLIPHGMEHNSPVIAAIAFLAGSICIWLLNSFLKTKGGAVSQFMGMFLDYIPECVVLGADCCPGRIRHWGCWNFFAVVEFSS